MKTKKILLNTLPLLIIGTAMVYAAAPSGGYLPGAITDPDCAPGDTDCFVKIEQVIDTDDQTLSLSGNTLSIEDGNNVDFSSAINAAGDGDAWEVSGEDTTSSIGRTGKVGIGTTNPTDELEIYESGAASMTINGAGSGFTAASILLKSRGSADYRGQGVFMLDSLGEQEWYAGTPYKLTDSYVIGRQITPDGTHQSNTSQLDNAFMIIDNTGNVGIGTTYPSQKLHVTGDANINGITVGRGGGEIASNTATGKSALAANTTGNRNTATGNGALAANTTGNRNTANGYLSLYSNIEGGYNTANGYSSLYANTEGYYNTGIGYSSLRYNITGNSNTANGYFSLYSNTEGNYNTAIGYNTGRGITTGSNNTILGASVVGLPATLSNNIILADGAGNQRIRVIDNGNVGIGTTTPSQKLEVNGTALAAAWNTASDKRLKKNIVLIDSPIKKIQQLRGVYFDWKSDNSHDVGVIAQEVEVVFPEIVTTDDEGIKSVDYAKITSVLIEAIKELWDSITKNAQKIDELTSENEELKKQLHDVTKRIELLEKGQ